MLLILSKTKPFFAFFESLVTLITDSGAAISRSGGFGADDDAGQMDEPITLPLNACGVTRGYQ